MTTAAPVPTPAPTPATNPAPAPAATPAPAPAASRRRMALAGVSAAVLLGLAAYGGYWALVLRHLETTDNAYVQGNVVQITPQQAGTVVAILADDTDAVRAGQPLLRLDPADARSALAQAEATLAQTLREVRTLYANNGTQQAQIQLRQAELGRANADLARALDDQQRRRPLLASGAVSREEFEHASAQVSSARSALAAAQSALLAAREQLAAGRTLTDGSAIAQHPQVLRVAARLQEAALALSRTELLAPVDGQVARRNVQLGQRVAAGAPLLSVVALDRVWVEANFKESQLGRLRVGQPATLVADVYGKEVQYPGRIEGLGAGTGAAFALLPAQNATGNWIKVVQRLPVRISLDPAALKAHPLRVGLSMQVQVDVSRGDGRQLAETDRARPDQVTEVYAQADAAAQARVRRFMAAQGLPSHTAAASAASAAVMAQH